MSQKKPVRHLRVVKSDEAIKEQPVVKEDEMTKHAELFSSIVGRSRSEITEIRYIIKEFLAYSKVLSNDSFIKENLNYIMALNKQMDRIL